MAQGSVLSERTFARYRAASTTVFEREWRQTRDALGVHRQGEFLAPAPGGAALLRRTPAADRRRGAPQGEAGVRGAAGVDRGGGACFARPPSCGRTGPIRSSASCAPSSRIDDIERGADALAQAERYGYAAGNRDWVLLGEGYLTRAAKLAEQRGAGIADPRRGGLHEGHRTLLEGHQAGERGGTWRSGCARPSAGSKRCRSGSSSCRRSSSKNGRHERHLHDGRGTRSASVVASGSTRLARTAADGDVARRGTRARARLRRPPPRRRRIGDRQRPRRESE